MTPFVFPRKSGTLNADTVTGFDSSWDKPCS